MKFVMVAFFVLLSALGAFANERVVLASGPGSFLDAFSRVLLPQVEKFDGRKYVIEPKGGAAGDIAAKSVLSDPSQLLFTHGAPFLSARVLNPEAFDRENSFAYVPPLFYTSFYLVTSKKTGADTLDKLKEYIASKDQTVTATTGNLPTIINAVFTEKLDKKTTMVYYKTYPELMVGILRGDVDYAFVDPAAMDGQDVNVIGSTGFRDTKYKTMTELGMPEIQFVSLYFFATPNKDKYSTFEFSNNIRKALNTAEVAMVMHGLNIQVVDMSYDQMQAYIRKVSDEAVSLVKRYNITK